MVTLLTIMTGLLLFGQPELLAHIGLYSDGIRDIILALVIAIILQPWIVRQID